MGLEIKACIVPFVEPKLLLAALKDKFVSLGWQLIYDKLIDGFSVSTHALRLPGEREIDATIGLLSDDGQIIYVTSHSMNLDEIDLTVISVNEVVKSYRSRAWGEEA